MLKRENKQVEKFYSILTAQINTKLMKSFDKHSDINCCVVLAAGYLNRNNNSSGPDSFYAYINAKMSVWLS